MSKDLPELKGVKPIGNIDAWAGGLTDHLRQASGDAIEVDENHFRRPIKMKSGEVVWIRIAPAQPPCESRED